MNCTRRHFLKCGGAMGFTAGTGLLSALGASSGFAADAGGYKAMVCLFLNGGLDGADTILPTDDASWRTLRGHRREIFDAYGTGDGSSSRDPENLLPLGFSNAAALEGRAFGLPPELATLHRMFADGDAAIVGNVGAILEPTTRRTVETARSRLPEKLFSHNDQASNFLSLAYRGRRPGWGGRFVDAAMKGLPDGDRTFAAVQTGPYDEFLTSDWMRPFPMPSRGPVSHDVVRRSEYLGADAKRDPNVQRLLEEHFAASGVRVENVLMQDVADLAAKEATDVERYREAYRNRVPLTTAFPRTRIGEQLRTIAETMSLRGSLGASRQMFIVNRGGFDIHAGQSTNMPRMLTEVADGIEAFRSAMLELGLWDSVVMFSGSEFGRTLVGNHSGTDHGWGGHQFVLGGPVAGGKLYGELPPYDLDDERYTASRGRLIPSVAIDQYAATLGRWFGLNPSELDDIFPNLANFDAKDLGFLG